MAKFRKVHTSFWSDAFVSNLTPQQKYFFLYLITNEKTRQCGIYEITERHMCFDTGYSSEEVATLMKFFIKEKKIVYSKETNEIALLNWNKFNDSTSPKVKKCVEIELKDVKNKVLIQYLYSIGTQSQEEQEEEEEREEEQESPSQPALPDLKDSNLYRQPKIPTFEKVHELFIQQGGTKEMAEKFYQKHDATGWFLNNSPIVNIGGLIATYRSNWQKNSNGQVITETGRKNTNSFV